MDRKGLGLRTVQWFFRGMQCASATIILAIYSYILATLHNHKLSIKNSARATEGIAGFAVLYAMAAIVLLCCIAWRTLAAFAAMVLDFAFIIAFIYVAAANKMGASSCNGELNTMFGKGNSTEKVDNEGNSGFTKLPTYKQACKLESAVLGLAIIAIFFFVFSLLTEVALGRNYWRQKRQQNDTDYLTTNPAGAVIPPAPGTLHSTAPKPSFWARIFSHKNHLGNAVENENMLPEHSTPGEMHRRPEPPTHGMVTDLGERGDGREGEGYEQVITGEVSEGFQSPMHVVPQHSVDYDAQHVVNNPYDEHQVYDAPGPAGGITYQNNYESHSQSNIAYGHQKYDTSPSYDVTPGYGNQPYNHPIQNTSYVTMPVPYVPARPLPYPQTPPRTAVQLQPRYEPYSPQNAAQVSPRVPVHGGGEGGSGGIYNSGATGGGEAYGERPAPTGGRLPVDYQYDDGLFDRR